MADRPDYILETYIRTTQDALWDALTNPEKTQHYYYGSRIKSDLKRGGPFQYFDGDGGLMLDGEIVEIEPKSKIVSTFIATWAQNGAPTRVTFEITPMGEVCKFTITHHDYEKANAGVESGWPLIASGLKTLLETGKPMPAVPAM